MITVITAKTAVSFKSEKLATDPARLDRVADILVSQGFRRQGELLAHRAAEQREGRS